MDKEDDGVPPREALNVTTAVAVARGDAVPPVTVAVLSSDADDDCELVMELVIAPDVYDADWRCDAVGVTVRTTCGGSLLARVGVGEALQLTERESVARREDDADVVTLRVTAAVEVVLKVNVADAGALKVGVAAGDGEWVNEWRTTIVRVLAGVVVAVMLRLNDCEAVAGQLSV